MVIKDKTKTKVKVTLKEKPKVTVKVQKRCGQSKPANFDAPTFNDLILNYSVGKL